MSLPADVARCTGAGLPECADCLRRTMPVDPQSAVWMSPPTLIVFECEGYIEP
jgi:hypothetical protein